MNWKFWKTKSEPEPFKVHLTFRPQEDLSVYELMHIPGVFLSGGKVGKYIWSYLDEWNEMPDSVKRHFEVRE